MNETVAGLVYIFTGISFSIGLINLVIGLQKDAQRVYLFFGFIALTASVYYFLFPLADPFVGHFTIRITIGLSFFICSFGFFPWFIGHYTGYHKRAIQWFLTGIMAVSITLLLLTRNQYPYLWNMVGHAGVIGIISYGFLGSRNLFLQKKATEGILFTLAFIVFSLLTVEDIIHVYFQQFYPFNLPEGLLPFDYFLLFFIVLIGLNLSRDIRMRGVFEKQFHQSEEKWSDLLEKLRLFILEVDKKGVIVYANPYFSLRTGYRNQELLNNKIFNSLLAEADDKTLHGILINDASNDLQDQKKCVILTKDENQIFLSCSILKLTDDSGQHKGTLIVGTDFTRLENACREISMLKKKLEKENIILKAKIEGSKEPEEIIGNSPAIKYTIRRALEVAKTNASVLIEGETGTGKELFARMIYKNSKRKNRAFISVNCTTFPRELMESELFGHIKGAFTGADKSRKGKFELADGGTLFLDEIGDLPLELQPKLLRVLQEGTIEPLGSEKTIKVNVRIIAATNQVLTDEVNRKRFRDDLFYRLNVFPITVPPLRQRKEDIPLLVNAFTVNFALKHGKKISNISKHVLEILQDFAWPGNVRELQNIIERAVITSPGDSLVLPDLLANDQNKEPEFKENMSMAEVERRHIVNVLKSCDWKVSGKNGAAEILGLHSNTLRSRMQKLNISKN